MGWAEDKQRRRSAMDWLGQRTNDGADPLTTEDLPAVDRAPRLLSEAGILTAKNEHGRDRRRDVVWRSDEVITALDEFAARARRARP